MRRTNRTQNFILLKVLIGTTTLKDFLKRSVLEKGAEN